jgi:chromosomal replication initiator protein
MSPSIGINRPAARHGAERILLLNENRFAYAAIEQLAEAGGTAGPRLVFLSGPAGYGKSLLARRFVHLELSARPEVRMAHVTAAEFAAEFAEASDNGIIARFQERYRALDVLVLEDVRALSKRWETLQQLQFILDEILATGGRVLLTSRSLPGELPEMPPRLINRFHSGTCASIAPLDYPGRLSLLQHFAQTRQIPITYESTELLAQQLPVSPRELLATLTQLDHVAREHKTRLDVSSVRRYLEGEIKPAPPTLAEITRAAARHFSAAAADLRGHSRKQSLVLPRQCAMYLARSLTSLSLVKIAEHFGGRHHSSVAHACQRIRQAQQEHPGVRQHLTQISQLLHEGPR